MADDFQLLNPLTPMAYLLPKVAYETTIAAYIVVGIAGALIWDVLINVDGDYRLLFKHDLSYETVVYFLSRESTLVFTLLETVFQTAPLENCQTIQRTISTMNHIAACSTALLFFLRIRTSFVKNNYVVVSFSVLWLAVLGGTVSVSRAVSSATFLGPTKYCNHGSIMAYADIAPITFAVNNTFLFLAVAWRLVPISLFDPSIRPDLVARDYLSTISNTFLRDGQIFYLITVLCNWTIVIVSVLRRDLPAYWFTFTAFNLAMTNMMICRVYRHTTFGEHKTESNHHAHIQNGRPTDANTRGMGTLRFAPGVSSVTIDLTVDRTGTPSRTETETVTHSIKEKAGGEKYPVERVHFSTDADSAA